MQNIQNTISKVFCPFLFMSLVFNASSCLLMSPHVSLCLFMSFCLVLSPHGSSCLLMPANSSLFLFMYLHVSCVFMSLQVYSCPLSLFMSPQVSLRLFMSPHVFLGLFISLHVSSSLLRFLHVSLGLMFFPVYSHVLS